MEELKTSGCEVAYKVPDKSAIDPWALTDVENQTRRQLLQNRNFTDSIGRCGAYMKKYENYDKPGLEYDIPYRILVPQKVDGLLATGRCISATHEALNTLRLVVPCMLLGEAAGTAAAIACEDGSILRNINIEKLKTKLIIKKR